MAFDAVGLSMDLELEENEDQFARPKAEDDWLDKLQKVDDPTVDSRQNMSFAEINQKRKQLTFKVFADNDFLDRIIVISELVRPNVEVMHRVFSRTGGLADLRFVPKDSTQKESDDGVKITRTAAQILVDN